MKVDPSGNQIWGTLLGGPTADNATALAIDTNGNVVLTGSTGGQFPTTPGAAIESSTSATVFAAKVTADGSKAPGGSRLSRVPFASSRRVQAGGLSWTMTGVPRLSS
jgi:hypothetical protein